MDYEQQVLDFAKNANLSLTSRYIGHMKYFDNDKQERSVFECTLKMINILTLSNLDKVL
jgi:hypothetical protein